MATINGKIGGIEIRVNKNEITLFNRKTLAKNKMIMVCRPYRGVTPTNKPQEMDSAFTLLLPWLSKIFSTKNLFHPFLRKYL